MSTDNSKQNGYLSFNSNNKEVVLASYGSVVDKYDSLQKSSNKSTATTLNTDQHIRSPFSRYDYEKVRPGERMPTRFKEVIHSCRAMYLKVGIVRNVIDMMTDFATEDLKIIHPDKKQEAFFKVWMNKVKLKDAIDEFVRHFLVDGNVVVKRTTAKLTKPVETEWRSIADDGPQKLYVEDNIVKREIPWKYSFLNVASLKWLGGEYGKLDGERKLGFFLNSQFLKNLQSADDLYKKNQIDKMPNDLVKSLIDKKEGFVELDMSSIYVAHNKKDSWEDWAPPFLYSVVQDVSFRDKLRQAEISALDGVINVIRLWKLGDHTEGILPNQAAVDKLIAILETNTGGGAIDLVWDSMINMEQFYPPVDEILGSEKYQQVNRDILIGLGVPEVLIGGKGGNFSNSFIQLKTLVEKLQYVRNRVIEWLTKEVEILCSAMEIEIMPKIKFSKMNLEDQETTKQLIVQLLDRGVISAEAVLDVYGEDFLIEMDRIKSQKDIFKNAGVKIKSPLDPKPAKGGSSNFQNPDSKTGKTGPGRPPGIKVNQKERKPKPRRSSGLTLFAFDCIDAIDEYIIPAYMDDMNIANARKLNNEQKEILENARVSALSTIKPNDNIVGDNILSIVENSKNYDIKLFGYIKKYILNYISKNGMEPTIKQRKRIEAIAWSSYFENIDNIKDSK